jgi:uncharacterized repeat protein (TIGR03803 family)
MVLTLAALVLISGAKMASADGIATLYEFSPGTAYGNLILNADGWSPNGLTLGPNGLLYGTTFTGGKNATGVVFKLDTHGSMTTLHTFGPYQTSSGGNSDGAQPVETLLLASDGNFYGITAYGGRAGNGTLFKVTPQGAVSRLYYFSALNTKGGNADGAVPFGSLIQGADGALYGTTALGGKYGSGVIFRFVPGQAAPLSVLYHFSALDANGFNVDGAMPAGALFQTSDGTLYGTASAGGANADGTIFKFVAGGALTVLHTFEALDVNGNDSDGASPQNGVTLGPDGDLYGVAPTGGVYGNGTIFKVSTDGVFTTVHSFTPTTDLVNREGEEPYSPLLLLPNGQFYGTAALGGPRSDGTIFRFGTGEPINVIYDFGVTDANHRNLDGIGPNGLVLGADGRIYGTTQTGSNNGGGTIFRVGPAISSLNPASVQEKTAFTLTINGSGFSANDKIYWNKIQLPTTFVSGAQLTTAVPANINNRYPASVTISVVSASGTTVTATLTVTK